MTDDLYERYKEALRVGHVAVLRGALEEAGAAYRTAASIAPSRALPHTSLGGVLLRLGHLDEALVEYAAAVVLAPRDEGALLGQAEALNAAGQWVDAAMTLDHVSEVQEAAGRLPEAADTLRRAIALEESAERSRRQRGLLRQIRLSAGDQAAEQLLARALRIRDEPIAGALEPARFVLAAAPSLDPDLRPGVRAESVARWPALPSMSPPEHGSVDPPVVATAPNPEVAAVLASPIPGPLLPDAPAEEGVTADGLETVGVMDGGLDRAHMEADGGRQESAGDELLDAAEAAELAGDAAALRSLLLGTARAYAREGRFEAGLDATHRLLQLVPSDVDAHLALVDMYVARDWNALAVEKLVLLGRLAELNSDRGTRARLQEVVGRSFPTDERLSALRP